MDTLYVSAYLIASPSVSPFLPVSRSCSLSSLMSNLTAASSLVSPLIFLRYFRRFPIVPKGIGSAVKDANIAIRPQSQARKYPDYIPLAIRSDYEEASAILYLSPKASATLSRRCLQGMIRDFFQITESNLYKEINAIKDKIPADQWAVLDGVRRIGNIGAYMEKDINLIVDIEPDEAQKLIKLIELLMQQWYIERHDQQQLYSDIIGIDQEKQAKRKKME